LEEEEVSTTEEQIDDGELFEVHGMWDFILPLSENEEEEEDLLVATRSKSTTHLPQKSQKQKSLTPVLKEKAIGKKYSPKSTQTFPPQSNSSPLAKTLLIYDDMEYNIVKYMNNTKANITLYDLSKLKHQQKLLLKELNVVPTSPLPAALISQATQGMGKPPSTSSEKVKSTNVFLIGHRYNFHTPPLLLTFEFFNKNLHNCLVDSGASC